MSARDDFLDTNILVYAFDASDPVRQSTASRVLGAAINSRNGVVSIQVLKEFHQVVTRKLASPLPMAEARVVVRDLATTLRVVDDSLEVLRDALRLCEAERISLWDAFVAAAAALAGCKRILTEDLSHDRVLLGVRVVNPFISTPEAVNEPTEVYQQDQDDDWPTLT
jgi:predicted nucleic acid-binding protein